MARTLERCLRSWGYETVIALDGLEAWRVLKREDTPLLAILDWDMPGLSGVEVCRMLRSTPHGASVYVVMLTARQDKNDLVQALESGADDFISKPFDTRELQLRLAKGVRDSNRTRDRAREPGATPPPMGTTLGGKYRLERQIAKGGMGSVWLGVHLSLGVNVAIKFMDAHLAETDEYASFEREARAAAQLRSEHTVRVYDHGIDRAGLPYLVMEYLDGESLWSRVDRKGALAPAEVVACIDNVARALGEAHAQQIIHRDVKPENILFLEDIERPVGFTAKLIDFGLANRSTGRGRPVVGPTAGTPSYMSPEYLRADIGPSPALDLWGLAATAFVAMTGQVPFEGDTLSDVYRRVCTEPPPVPSRVAPHVSPAFDAWFARACAPDPAERFQTAGELAVALARACSGAETATGSRDPSGLQSLVTEPDSVRTIETRAAAKSR